MMVYDEHRFVVSREIPVKGNAHRKKEVI